MGLNRRRTIRYSLIKTELAGSDDLGIAIGGYDATRADGSTDHGTYVRAWKRDLSGRWRVVFETSTPAR